jgi:Tfp pilus assembly PilM family ATPase
MEMALLSRFRKCLKPDVSGNTILAYRLNEQEAILLILAHNNSFISRRIYGTSSRTDFELPSFSLEMEKEESAPSFRPQEDIAPNELWNNFLPDIQQTINFYVRQSGNVLDTLYLAGPGVPSQPDPDNLLADQLALKVKPIQLLADIELGDGVEKDCPAVEILAGAAMLWHQKG